MTASSTTATRRIAQAAGTVMIAFVFSNLAGLARQILTANAFGTQMGIDAFSAANRVSETLFNLVAGGALSSAFIPTFTALLTRNETKRAWRLASAIANLMLVILSIAGIVVWVFAPWIVQNILAPGFASDPAKEALTVDLLRLMLPSAVIFGLSGLAMGILNSNQVFLYPALAPAMYQVGMICGILFLSPSMGIYGLAWGVILGATMHLLMQIPMLLGLGGSYTFTFGQGNQDAWEVARLMGPRLLGVAIVQLNFWINTRLASRFVDGSVIGLVMGFTLMLMPQAAIAQSIAIAAMPTFSAQVALGKLEEMRSALASSLRGALLLSIPASFGLIILRTPIVATLYQRGEFDARSTYLVTWALLWFSAGLVGHALVEILSRAFYAMHDTKTPVFVGIVAMSLNVALSYAFSALFLKWGWMPHGGLALANSTATALEAVGLVWIMRNRLGGLEGNNIWSGVARTLVATLVMAAVLLGWIMNTPTEMPAWLSAAGGMALGGMAFLLGSLVLRIDEVQRLLNFVRRRLVRR